MSLNLNDTIHVPQKSQVNDDTDSAPNTTAVLAETAVKMPHPQLNNPRILYIAAEWDGRLWKGGQEPTEGRLSNQKKSENGMHHKLLYWVQVLHSQISDYICGSKIHPSLHTAMHA